MRLINDFHLPTTIKPLTRRSQYRKQRQLATTAGFLLLGILGITFLVIGIKSRRVDLTKRQKEGRLLSGIAEPLAVPDVGVTGAAFPTLVIYVFANTDPEYEDNLRHFIREGVHERDGCSHVIAIQLGPELPPIAKLPALPSNARYVYHKNECFDSGTVGWVLETQVKPRELKSFKYVVWLNGSQRGPFMPAYVKRRMHWTEALTDRLTGKVKMVGATIHCGVPFDVPAVPHVQSYLVAVDQIGLDIIRQDSKALKCWATMKDTVIHSELGASAAIFLAGYSIDCLMLRYQGVNWRSMDALDCNAGRNPTPQGFNDGITIDPLEVMFVKVKSGLRKANWGYVQQAVKYDNWSQHERGLTAADLQANSWSTEIKPQLVEEAHTRGVTCFDDEFYVSSAPSELDFILQAQNTKYTAWNHFIEYGLAEGRPHRYTC